MASSLVAHYAYVLAFDSSGIIDSFESIGPFAPSGSFVPFPCAGDDDMALAYRDWSPSYGARDVEQMLNYDDALMLPTSSRSVQEILHQVMVDVIRESGFKIKYIIRLKTPAIKV